VEKASWSAASWQSERVNLIGMTRDPVYILAVLAFCVALSEWLARKTILRHVGSALVVILIAAVFANTGVIPAYEPGIEIYDGIFTYGVYVGVFWLLLLVRLVDVKRAGWPMLVLFAFGAAGTTLGVMVGMWAVDGANSIGEHWRGIGGMFVGTYTGGSANLNLIAAEYGVTQSGSLFIGVNAVDAIMTTFYMIATIAIPRILWRFMPGRPKKRTVNVTAGSGDGAGGMNDTETLHPFDLGILLALGAGGYWLSGESKLWLDEFLSSSFDQSVKIPKAIVLTVIALTLAQLPMIARLRGTRVLGMFAVMMFLSVIGCLCNLAALDILGELAITLWIFAAIVIAVHALVIFGLAAVFRFDWDMAAVASQSNVGGGTTAIALARSLGRPDLVLPGILVGALGTASGTFLGIIAVEYLL
jgi:uncharacterized membrane protein